jgi:hypothetical protein
VASVFRGSHSFEIDNGVIRPNRIATAVPKNLRDRSMQLAEIAKLEAEWHSLTDAAAKEAAAHFLPQTAEYVRAAWTWQRGLSGPLPDFCRSRGLHLPALERWLKYLDVVPGSTPPVPKPDWWSEWKAVVPTKDEAAAARVAMKVQAGHQANKFSPFYDPGATGFPLFTRDQQTRIHRLAEEIDDRRRRLPQLDEVHGVREGGIPGVPHEIMPETPTLPRFLAAAGGADAIPIETRLDLANWMAAGGRVVIARLLVNRVWGELFSRELVGDAAAWWGATPPPHRDILDSLAAELIASEWSLTVVLRRILQSTTWCEPAASGGSAFVPRPMKAPELRDAVVSVSGELDGRLYGIAMRDPEALRRSLYLFRTAGEHPVVMAPAFINARVGRLAGLCREKAGGDREAQIDWLFQRLMARGPSPEERDAARSTVERHSLPGLARRVLENDRFRSME